MRSSPQRKQCPPRPRGYRPRPKERGQRRRGSTDCIAATAKRQADRRAVPRAGPPRSRRTRSRTDRTGRWVRIAGRSQRDSRAATEPPVVEGVSAEHGRTARSRCTLIPRKLPTTLRPEQARKCAVKVGGQALGPGGGRISPDHNRRASRQPIKPVTGDVPQLPLHPIADDRVADRLGDDEAHSGRCLSSDTTQVDDERSATGTSSPTHCGCEVTAVTHSVSGGKHPYDRNSAIRRKARRDPCDGEPTGWRGRPACSCAAESHASWHGAGYSAGTSACSREDSRFVMQIGGQLTSDRRRHR
jgi:hypothetical protein